ncbi:unnamed protein product [Dracunculus medinensis]|uniref:Uncharacterized protein n=1 Tax=Dracunculus medinensis TaxID=318479 RepID=A0A3P7Q6Q2_DRAME|nr:unnamed protein product [Dracunculus medinensis]
MRDEFVTTCMRLSYQSEKSLIEFCQAYENICFDVPMEDSINRKIPSFVSYFRITTTTTENPHDYILFCREFKHRFLYVCPDPLRFGQKAIFCPLYAERCDVALPDRSIIPTRPHNEHKIVIASLCSRYKMFANNYCRNPFFQGNYKSACEKYFQFCTSNHR